MSRWLCTPFPWRFRQELAGTGKRDNRNYTVEIQDSMIPGSTSILITGPQRAIHYCRDTSPEQSLQILATLLYNATNYNPLLTMEDRASFIKMLMPQQELSKHEQLFLLSQILEEPHVPSSQESTTAAS